MYLTGLSKDVRLNENTFIFLQKLLVILVLRVLDNGGVISQDLSLDVPRESNEAVNSDITLRNLQSELPTLIEPPALSQSKDRHLAPLIKGSMLKVSF